MAGWVDTVYLGAYRVAIVRAAGGYAEDVGVNEDSELALRMADRGGVWFDPSITSTYVPRGSLPAVAKQFYWYGRSRAATVKKHPGSVSPRQLAAPALVVALATPARRHAAAAYACLLAAGAFSARRTGPKSAALVPLTMAAMHLSWGVGFLQSVVLPEDSPTARMDRKQRAVSERTTFDRLAESVAPSVQPVADSVDSEGLAQRANRPSGGVDGGDGPWQVFPHQQQPVA
jgi:hypothetical protein